MGCCSSTESASGELQQVVLQDPNGESQQVLLPHPMEPLGFDPQIILPASDASEWSEQRQRFMTNVSIIDANETSDDAIILPPRKGSACSARQAPVESRADSPIACKSISNQELLFAAATSRAQRLETAIDVYGLDSFWGVGPHTPDRRLEAGMPGHTLVTEVEEVMVKKSDSVQRIKDQLPLDDLCATGEKYMLFQLNFGKACIVSLHRVINADLYEKVLHAGGGDLLRDSLKLIVTPVNLKLNVPVKGPKEADTIGSFFGAKNAHFSRPVSVEKKHDVAMISVDLYSVWSLKMLLPSVAFKVGRMVDFHLVSYRDNAVLASYRAAMTPEAVRAIKAATA